MVQEDRLIATSLVAVAAVDQVPHQWEQRNFPKLPSLDNCWLMKTTPPLVPLHSRWDRRWGLGVPGVPDTSTIPGGYEAGGWIRLSEPEPYDEALLRAMSDAWVPAIMAHTDLAVHAPTLELTVQFRTDPRELDMTSDTYCAAVFRQLSGREGFIDETGEILVPQMDNFWLFCASLRCCFLEMMTWSAIGNSLVPSRVHIPELTSKL